MAISRNRDYSMTGKIAITGATGFIGSALIERLIAAGKHIQALVRPASAHKQPVNGAVQWIQGDLDDPDSLRQLVHGAEVIIHCAGIVRGATREQFNRVNVDGLVRLAQAASELQPVPRFLLISSLAAREPQLSAHAASKQQGEHALMDSCGNTEWTVFRPTAVYGPGDREIMPVLRSMARGVAPLMGSGNGRLSFIYIADLVDAIVRWLDCRLIQRGTYELHDGNPAGYSWHDIVDMIAGLRGAPVVRLRIPVSMVKLAAALNIAFARAVGYAPMLTPGKVRELTHTDWTVDNAAICEDIGWSPKIKLAEGLRRTLGLNHN
jgi:nucleoside-diphosphate-sugar epimerase